MDLRIIKLWVIQYYIPVHLEVMVWGYHRWTACALPWSTGYLAINVCSLFY